jgi:hypothetical protein
MTIFSTFAEAQLKRRIAALDELRRQAFAEGASPEVHAAICAKSRKLINARIAVVMSAARYTGWSW